MDGGSRLYVSGLSYRHASRGLDGYTHALLASLADRLLNSHLGHQAQGASIDPFHTFLGGLDEQRSKVSAATLGDAAQNRTATGTVLPWDETEPGAEVPSSIRGLTGADRGDGAVEISGPTPGTLISRRQLPSRWLISSISW
jgi:hypothetical protein